MRALALMRPASHFPEKLSLFLLLVLYRKLRVFMKMCPQQVAVGLPLHL
eukprot:jgi/Antlo1/1290/2223